MGGRAVVVEDFVLLSQVWSALLTSMNYSVSVFHEAENVSEMILELEPEIILMDVNLEGTKTGIDLSEILKEKNIPVINLNGLFDNPFLSIKILQNAKDLII